MHKIEPMPQFFTDFRDLLVNRLNDWPNPELVDQDALNLGLYLQDLRLAADLTPLELAEKTALAEAEIVALEHGLIVSGKITAHMLHTLAQALEADVADLALVLGQPNILTAVPVKQVSHAWSAYFNHRGLAIFVACLFGLILFGTALLWWNAPTSIQTTQVRTFTTDTNSDPIPHPYNWKFLSQASLVILLVILAFWWGISQRHAWTAALRGRSWQLGALATSLSLMLLMLFVPHFMRGEREVSQEVRYSVPMVKFTITTTNATSPSIIPIASLGDKSHEIQTTAYWLPTVKEEQHHKPIYLAVIFKNSPVFGEPGISTPTPTFTPAPTFTPTPGVRPDLSVEVTQPLTAKVGKVTNLTYYIYHTSFSDGSSISDLHITNSLAERPTYATGDTNKNELLESNETWVFTASYLIRPSDNSPLTSVTTVEGEIENGNSLVASDTHNIEIAHNPILKIVQTSQPAEVKPGDRVTYTLIIRNMGNRETKDVKVVSTIPDYTWEATEDRAISLVLADIDKDGYLENSEWKQESYSKDFHSQYAYETMGRVIEQVDGSSSLDFFTQPMNSYFITNKSSNNVMVWGDLAYSNQGASYLRWDGWKPSLPQSGNYPIYAAIPSHVQNERTSYLAGEIPLLFTNAGMESWEDVIYSFAFGPNRSNGLNGSNYVTFEIKSPDDDSVWWLLSISPKTTYGYDDIANTSLSPLPPISRLLLFSQTSAILSILTLMFLVIYREGRIAESIMQARKAMVKPELRPPRLVR